MNIGNEENLEGGGSNLNKVECKFFHDRST